MDVKKTNYDRVMLNISAQEEFELHRFDEWQCKNEPGMFHGATANSSSNTMLYNYAGVRSKLQ